MLQNNMVNKCFFFYFLILLCSQVKPTVFAAFITYTYWGALGLNTAGCLFERLRILRMFGMLIMVGMIIVIFFALVLNDWCNMFYFGSEFSLEYKA